MRGEEEELRFHKKNDISSPAGSRQISKVPNLNGLRGCKAAADVNRKLISDNSECAK